ncbi:hypothetical protein E8L90_27540 [Brevibacillus antibioticus]|uniref:Uncharacterized protein n=1 Tax=Brevibacillus antibioticus TaxID=2570228 RepID=A0A4V5TJC2_9BACL|nr:hypothetical protein [Brevibacillus antibioticus]TKI58843.1 hypothetical protein E8L90_27540 [Brevibacillus antibioticus]
MKKWNYILAGVLSSTLIFGGTPGFAQNKTENVTMQGTNSMSTDKPIGYGLHLWRNPGFKYTLEDRSNNIKLPIPVPEELKGESGGQEPITPALPHLDFSSDDSKYEFYMFHRGSGREVYLQLLQYEKGKLTSLGAIKVAEDVPNRIFGFYNDGRNSIYVLTLDTMGELNSSAEYVWDSETKKIIKVSELKAQ